MLVLLSDTVHGVLFALLPNHFDYRPSEAQYYSVFAHVSEFSNGN